MKINIIKPNYNFKNFNTSHTLVFKGIEPASDMFIKEHEKSAREKQLSGEFYNPADKEIIILQKNSRNFMKQFNSADRYQEKQDIMKKWFKSLGEKCFITGDFFCDFGCNLSLGKNVFINTGCVILDSAEVKIGDNTMIAPGVKLCTAGHSIIPEERLKQENVQAKPINIGKNCWLGAGVIVLPGVTIGDGTTIGAGSVVTKDIPPRCVAFGTPCKVIKNV